MLKARRPVSIDGLTFDALIGSSEGYEADVPAYPVDEGFKVSDTIIHAPLALPMTLYLTNTPVTWSNIHRPSVTRVRDAVSRLKAIYFAKKLVTVDTTDQTYNNMAIVSFSLDKNAEVGTSRQIEIVFQQVPVVEARTASLPEWYGREGETQKNAGTASVKTSASPGAPGATGGDVEGGGTEDKGRASIAYSIAKSAGLLGDDGGLSKLLNSLAGGG